MLLLVVQHLLQPEEVLAGLLVQLLVDVAVYRDELGHHHVLEGVHPAVGHLDLLVQGQEGRLQGGDRDKQVQDASELLSAFLDGEAAALQADLAHRVLGVLKLLEAEVGDEHSGDVLLGLVQPNGGALDSLSYFPSN